MIALLATLALAAEPLAWADDPPADPSARLDQPGSALDDGRYRLDVRIATATKVPFAGETVVTTHSTALVDLQRAHAGGVATQRVCAVWIEDDLKLSDTLIPDPFVDAYPVQQWPWRLDAEGRFAADPGPLALGWDPARTPDVPGEADHPAVVDWEADGHPGATVVLKVPVFGRVEVYVAQHGHSTYEGTVEGSRVTGQVDVVVNEQRTLGASNLLFKGETETRPLPSASTFTLAPVEADATCDDLAERGG